MYYRCMSTTIDKKYEILASFWAQNAEEPKYAPFVEHFRLGLACAYLAQSGMATMTDMGNSFVNQTWDSFMNMMGKQDTGFESLESVTE